MMIEKTLDGGLVHIIVAGKKGDVQIFDKRNPALTPLREEIENQFSNMEINPDMIDIFLEEFTQLLAKIKKRMREKSKKKGGGNI